MKNVPITQPMSNIPSPDSVAGQPVPMYRTGKVNGFMHAETIQWFYRLLRKTQTFGSVSPIMLMTGAWFLAVPISDMAKSSANEFLWRPRKSVPGSLVGGFTVAHGSPPR